LLGMELKTDMLHFKPCFPTAWPFITINYRYGNSTYKITVYQSKEGADSRWKMGKTQGQGNAIQLMNDGLEHQVEVYIRS